MYGDAVVLESGDKENNPLNQAITSALGSKPLDLKNKEDQATISAAVKAVEKKFGQINNMRGDSSVFAKNLLLAAALFCDFEPQAITKSRGHEHETAISKNIRGSLAKVVKMGLDGLKAMFPGAPDDFYKDAQPLAGEKLKMLEARMAKLEDKVDGVVHDMVELREGVEMRVEGVEKLVKEAPSRKSFEALKKENAETFEELKEKNEKLEENDKARNEKLVAHAKELEELKENDKALNEKNKELNEKLVAHAKELEELKEKNEELGENDKVHAKEMEELKEKLKELEELKEKLEVHVEFVGELRTNIMKHFKFSREVSKRELEEMMQNITNDLDKRIAGVSKASIKRDNEIKLAIAAPKPGAAKEEEWIEQL